MSQAKRPSLLVRIGAGLAALALVAGLVAGIASSLISSDDTSQSSSSTSSTQVPATTVPLTDDEFLATAGSLRGLIAAAEGDRCALVPAFVAMQNLPAPNSAVQSESGTILSAELINAAADTMGPEDAALAQIFRDTAAELLVGAEANDYDPTWLSESSPLADPAFTEALTAYSAKSFEECADEANALVGPQPNEPG